MQRMDSNQLLHNFRYGRFITTVSGLCRPITRFIGIRWRLQLEDERLLILKSNSKFSLSAVSMSNLTLGFMKRQRLTCTNNAYHNDGLCMNQDIANKCILTLATGLMVQSISLVFALERNIRTVQCAQAVKLHIGTHT